MKKEEKKPYQLKYKNIITGVVIFFIGVLFVSARDFLLRMENHFVLYGEKSSVLIRYDGYTILFGLETNDIEVLWKSISPYFTQSISIVLDQLNIGKNISHENLFLYKASKHFTYGNIGNVRIFFIGSLEDEDVMHIKQQKISFESDIWVLESNYFPNFMPPPSVGIVSLVYPRVSEKIKSYAMRMHLPFLNYKNTKGFSLEKRKDDAWVFNVREAEY